MSGTETMMRRERGSAQLQKEGANQNTSEAGQQMMAKCHDSSMSVVGKLTLLPTHHILGSWNNYQFLSVFLNFDVAPCS